MKNGGRLGNLKNSFFCLCYFCHRYSPYSVISRSLLAQGLLGTKPISIFFFILILDLLMAVFRLFEVFCFISFVNFERVCRSNQMTQKLEIWYDESLKNCLLISIPVFSFLKPASRFWHKILNEPKIRVFRPCLLKGIS